MEATEKKAASAITRTSSRLKREDCRHTKHDSAFSQWKVLIGPSDWEDHSTGKEEAERYRTQNLPNCASCTGVYEFGILRRQTGREAGKLNPDFIVPVYLGKADNVRNRLQQYGRDGSHLENGSSKSKSHDCNDVLAQIGPGLFRDIFSKGFSIVYRWAPMKNTTDAETTESDLLRTFDYAWNKGSNGPRRPNDIRKKLNRVSKTSPFSAKLKLFPRKREGIKIKAYEPPILENGLNFYTNLETNGLLYRIFKFGRSQPRLVEISGVNENYTSICGVALGHGVICKRPPSEGNKRCAEHKGMKVNSFTSKMLTNGKFTLGADEYPISKDFTPVCGVILNDGSSCTSKPVQGNKRCLEHKGRKICNSIPQPMKDKKELYVYGPVLDSNDQQHKSLNEAGKQFIKRDHSSTICGVDLDDGTFCTRQPHAGSKRCVKHKGMRINEKTISMSIREEIPSVFAIPGSRSSKEKSENYSFIPSHFDERISPTCGLALHNGSFCRRTVTEGNKRCWQHKGMRVDSSPSSSNNSRYYADSSRYTSYDSVHEDFSSTCGAPTLNGSYCRRSAAGGRCWQHEGMRVDSSPSSSNNSRYYANSSRYASYDSVHEDFSSTCGAPTLNGSYCRRSAGGGRCWQHRG